MRRTTIVLETYLHELVELSSLSIAPSFTIVGRRLLLLIAEDLRRREVVLIIA